MMGLYLFILAWYVFLILKIHLTYKFINPDIKNEKNVFLYICVFLKYMPSPRDFNKIFIKSIMNARYEKTLFLFFLNDKSCNVFYIYIYIYIYIILLLKMQTWFF